MGQSPDIKTISLEKRGVFLKNLKMGRSPDIETIFFLVKAWSFSKKS